MNPALFDPVVIEDGEAQSVDRTRAYDLQGVVGPEKSTSRQQRQTRVRNRLDSAQPDILSSPQTLKTRANPEDSRGV